MRQDDFQPGGDRFPLTRRSVIEAARSIDAQERERALEVLCAAYWRPVYKYVRWRWNRPVEAAQDLTQGFFAELLERARTFRLFEAYDLEGNEKSSYEQLSKDYGISVTDVTNALSWARREFRKIALDRLRELCGSEEEFQREARAAFGWDAQ